MEYILFRQLAALALYQQGLPQRAVKRKAADIFSGFPVRNIRKHHVRINSAFGVYANELPGLFEPAQFVHYIVIAVVWHEFVGVFPPASALGGPPPRHRFPTGVP